MVRTVSRLRSVVSGLVRRRRFEDAMADEMRFHVEACTDDLVARGVPRAEAERRARIEFGGVEGLKEDCRRARGLRAFDELRQDARYAWRLTGRTPLFSAAAILSLALGIGANTAIFSLIDAVLLQALPIERPHEVYFVAHGRDPRLDTSSNYPFYERLKAESSVFAGLTAYSTERFRVEIGDSPELADGQYVSGNYYAVLGVPFVLGQGFAVTSDRATAPSVVISEGYWTRRFGRDAAILAKTLTVNGRIAPIVGVTAHAFAGLEAGMRADVTLPLSMGALDEPAVLDAHDWWMGMPLVGRLHAGVGEAQARAAVDAVFRQYIEEPENRWAWEEARPESKHATLVPAARGSDRLRVAYGEPLRLLMALVGLVLLIASANVANLLLARGVARTREVALRIGLGASRARVVRQLLTESTLLALGGGLLGPLCAFWGVSAILAMLRVGEYPILIDVSVNWRVLAFTAGVSIVTGLAFGLVPALKATRLDLAPALKENGAAPPRGLRRLTLAKTLIAGQIAACVVCLAVCGLLVRSLRNLKTQDAGFGTDQVVLFAVDVASNLQPGDRGPLCADVVERLRRLPGVRTASCSTLSPVSSQETRRAVQVPGANVPRAMRSVWANVVSPGYFETLGVRLLRGRVLTSADDALSRRVAAINETMARAYFGDADPIGRTFGFGDNPKTWIEIVGLVRDARQQDLRTAVPRMAYTPLAQAEELPHRLTIELSTAQDPASLAPSARAAVRAASPYAVMDYMRTIGQQVDASLVRERLLATLSIGFGGLALALACVGLYGVFSYDVTRRAREIAIRIALGAAGSVVRRQVLRESLAIAAAGLAAGLGAAWATTGIVAAFLFGLSPRDPLTFIAAAALLLAAMAIAAWLPARRAAGIDPIAALKGE